MYLQRSRGASSQLHIPAHTHADYGAVMLASTCISVYIPRSPHHRPECRWPVSVCTPDLPPPSDTSLIPANHEVTPAVDVRYIQVWWSQYSLCVCVWYSYTLSYPSIHTVLYAVHVHLYTWQHGHCDWCIYVWLLTCFRYKHVNTCIVSFCTYSQVKVSIPYYGIYNTLYMYTYCMAIVTGVRFWSILGVNM